MTNKEHVFTIGEFGKRARITVRTLRFYEQLGLLTPTEQNSSGHKLYGLKELAKLQQIQSLKFIGYSLQEIKEILKDDTEAIFELERSLPLQHKLLIEKRDELNRAIEAVERVQCMITEGKPITWKVLASLLYQIEHEEDLKEWMKEYLSDEAVSQIFSLPKEQRKQMDMEMVDILATVKKLMKEDASPKSPEAFNVLIKITELATKHVEDKEELAKELEKLQELSESELLDYKFPTFFTREEEEFLMEIGRSMEALYNESSN
ncbi:MerR family transcriptional regulator [Cytobacillus sp. FJAT-54145]|uniref:MerR family transcriptional regulator n=1 Tax=Cytobacillus spartinae TaxID=3299023 RepID=A0ABW6K669_9BACI